MILCAFELLLILAHKMYEWTSHIKRFPTVYEHGFILKKATSDFKKNSILLKEKRKIQLRYN